MTKEERSALSKTLFYLGDALLLINKLEDMSSCQTCKIRKRCVYRPKPRRMMRFNCPLWQEEKEKGAEP